ncbi:queuine tRNA-ribosyltransferase [Angomonas deanei]|uniref:Queuine tRNA-ribosyltransferase, putative n=1 Tax=Angomonas deanei TaxID=59799 RepID=A0A7G2CBE6_9TRYP|nr:queuine tRNA-ribosyltransferase [Angomonas deanei]CAD2217098.1 Queuine tRNA-ribosyltransferase, putative [Angomonas deanei]|eukprot:EPY29845.1 queuine tRNA-ribosyltransferase [Angomonas deanei]
MSKVEGPFLVIPTARGTLPQLTPDQAREIFAEEERLMGMSVFEATQWTAVCKEADRSFAQLAGAGEFKLLLTCRNVLQGAHPSAPSSDKGIAADLEKGRLVVSPKDWCNVVSSLRPTHAVPLHDSIALGDPSAKKRRTMLTRSDAFLKEITASKESQSVTLVQDIGEYLLQGENISEFARNCRALPDGGLYYAGARSLAEYIVCLTAGFAFVEWSLPWSLAADGIALNLTLNKPSAEPVFIDLNDDHFTFDIQPLSEGCACFTCRSHHRAYIHHLLTVQEMNSEILLSIHNVHTANILARAFRQCETKEKRVQQGEALLQML